MTSLVLDGSSMSPATPMYSIPSGGGESGNDWEVVMPFDWAKRFTLWLLGVADKEEGRMTARGECREDFFPVMFWTRLQSVVGWRVDYLLRLEDGQGSLAPSTRTDYELVAPREVFEFALGLAKRLGLKAGSQMYDLEIVDENTTKVALRQRSDEIELVPLTGGDESLYLSVQDARRLRDWLDGAIAAIELGQEA